jgi:hypothetical protein
MTSRAILVICFLLHATAAFAWLPHGSASYVGPGDYVPGASFWCGLRGYSNATANTPKAINVRRSSDNATMDIGLINGTLDQATAATFAGTDATGTGSISGLNLTFTGGHVGDSVAGPGVRLGTVIAGGSSPNWTVQNPGNFAESVASTTITLTYGLYVPVCYDQSGNVNHGYQTTYSALQPQLFLYGPNNLPYFSSNLYAACCTGDGGGHYGTQYWVTSNSISLSSTFSLSVYFIPTPIGASTIILDTPAWAFYQHANSSQTTNIINGGGLSTALGGSSTTWYAAQIIYNSSSGVMYLNGAVTASGATTPVTPTVSTLGVMAQNYSGAPDPNSSEPFVGNVTEFGVWPVAFTSAQYQALGADQVSYWQ